MTETRDLTGRASACPPVRADAEVLRNDPQSAVDWRMVVRVSGWGEPQPGQFVMLSPGALESVSRRDPLLPRPMAIYRTHASEAGATELEILYKVSGRGTALLAEAQPGERIRVVGPLGEGFVPPSAGQHVVLVGGGTGIASLFGLAQQAAHECRVSVILGAREATALMGVEDFEALDVDLRLVTEDGSRGDRGLVTEVLDKLLAGEQGEASVYACGPTPMMRRCAEIAKAHGRSCIVSLENRMACGFGVCLGCAVPLSEGGYGLVCRQGPVFGSDELVWDGLP